MGWTRGQTIGRGSTAAVSIATTSSGDLFAIKSTELRNSEFLQREQKIISTLSNSHLVAYKGYDVTKEDNKVLYNLFLEYMSGGTLTDAIRCRGGPLDESVFRLYTCQILRGLEYIHSSGIAHCDIKGDNILIGKDGAKIADFGCAKWINDTAPGRIIGGTPMFMAPEVTRGENQGCPADIWALGCTVLEMATGNSPWPNVNDPLSILYTIAFSGKIPDIPDFLSTQARDFLGKCLIRESKERWTAKELLNHPFVKELSFEANKIGDFDTNSPTSILEQGIWSMVNEIESMLGDEQSRPSDYRARQIQLLGLDSGMAEWRWDVENSWITVRSNEQDGVISGSETELEDLIKFSDRRNVSSVESGIAISHLNFENHKQIVLNNKPQFL